MSAVDTLVLGAGVDGLVAALTLAKAGRKAVVLHGAGPVGGVAAGEAFAEGYRHVGAAHDSAQVSPTVIDALGLRAHGLKTRPRPTLWASGLRLDPDAVVGDLPSGDVAGYRRLRALLDGFRPFSSALMHAPPPDVRGDAAWLPLVKSALGLRRLGGATMSELLKIGPAAVDDLLAEYVSDPRLRAALALPALFGTWMAPLSPTSAAYFLLRDALLGEHEVDGGPAALVRALVVACDAAGVVIRAGSPVARIAVSEGAVQGVALEDGSELFARRVLCCLGPRRLLDLLPPLTLPTPDEDALLRVRARGILAKVHLGLRAPLALGGEAGVEHAVLADGPLHVERAFDAAKRGRLAERPPIEVRVPSVRDARLAPAGHHVVSVLVYGAPHALVGGWTAATRAALRDAVLDALAGHDAAIRDKVVAEEVLTPVDLEARYGLDGGHLDHAEQALDQLWSLRPTPGLAGYRAPIRGLYLGSRASHPAGLTLLPGHLAARVLANDAR